MGRRSVERGQFRVCSRSSGGHPSAGMERLDFPAQGMEHQRVYEQQLQYGSPEIQSKIQPVPGLGLCRRRNQQRRVVI